MLNKNPKYADALNDKGWAFISTMFSLSTGKLVAAETGYFCNGL